MANVTVRSIPDEIMVRLRTLAGTERRSLNSEILFLLERGLEGEAVALAGSERPVSPALQARLWEGLCGRWADERGWKEIADDIVSHRTVGREVAL